LCSCAWSFPNKLNESFFFFFQRNSPQDGKKKKIRGEIYRTQRWIDQLLVRY
jgi:hypothetical protein